MDAVAIVNSRAGGAAEIDDLATSLAPLGRVEVWATERPGHARELAARAAEAGVPLVISVGGDGTLNEVVNGLHGVVARRSRLGVLPGGTGNDFARTLAMPASLEGCVEVLRQGVTKRVDLVRITGDGVDRLSINVSAGGFSDEVAEALDPEMKASWGPLAYLRAALESLPERRAYSVTLTLDGVTVLHESVFNVIVANARFVAGGTQVAPYAEIDDGVFDLVVVKEVSLAGLAALASKVPSGMHLEDDEGRIVFKQVAQLEVESEPAMPFNADGELLEGVVRRFEIVPGALEVVVPEPAVEED